MRSRARRLAWPAAILGSMLVAATPTPVEALEPPTGVLFDGRVTVVVVGSSGPDSSAEMAIADASVMLVPTVADGAGGSPIGRLATGLTGPDGSVELTEVTGPAETGREVRLAIEATRRTEVIDADGCTRTEVWAGDVAGDVAGVPAPPPEPVVVRAKLVVTTLCPTRPTIQGRLLDAAGDPLLVESASVEVAAADGPAVTVPLAVGADGGFLAELQAIGTWTEPALVTLRATAAVTRSEPFGRGCVRTLADAVTWSQAAAQAEGGSLPSLELNRLGAGRRRAVRCRGKRDASTAPPTPRGAVSVTPAPTAGPTMSPTRSPSMNETPRPPRATARSRHGPPSRAPDATGPTTSTATPQMVALLLALVAVAVTLAS